MGVSAIIAIGGIVLLLIGVLGGGVTAKEIQIPPISTPRRIVSSLTGILLLGISIYLSMIAPTPPYATTAERFPPTTNVSSTDNIISYSKSTPVLLPTQEPTSTHIPLDLPDVIVSGNASNGVLFIAPEDGNYEFTIKEGIYCTPPSRCRSIIRGYLNREISWKENDGLPQPMDADYELGCWETAIANDPDCGVGLSTIIFMQKEQYIRWVAVETKGSFADNTGAVILRVVKTP
ncbi:MAG TPA: hypothetical protein ENJ35_07825 [Gammaproteobacteria bacterium]|nr:hypothetical protein [Gammaproteobacteria bacterium]